MSNTKNIKRALLLSLLALVACVSMLVSTTFAWFNDSVTSAENIITSGRLDVEMFWAEGTDSLDTMDWFDASNDAVFHYDRWEPGYALARHLKVANVGNLSLKYDLLIQPEEEVTDLADVIDVYVFMDGQPLTDRDILFTTPPVGSLSDMLTETIDSGTLAVGAEKTMTIVFKMRESAGNEYQAMSVGDFSVVLLATQHTEEKDSFGSDYDAGAVYADH